MIKDAAEFPGDKMGTSEQQLSLGIIRHKMLGWMQKVVILDQWGRILGALRFHDHLL